ncbi:Rhodanese-like domain [Pseudocohnilembus persalinus]|uniref:Rhodanese-like domain n=1 Tax=Pseudocohnilembus persalinus TaxID=266149 RepID=A0A0V0QWH8_PSEPJ|nr:Rhodanese-like domain [Pseudocohnilembus persalinus]|eukprot:KRX06587.1 Rhodanese-like domain [Pseudocohnilembus persalinus]
MQALNKQLNVQQVSDLLKQGVKLLDTRNRLDFLKGYIKGSYFLYNGDKFAMWMEKLFKKDDKFVIMCQEQERNDINQTLEKLGFSNCVQGYLINGIQEWQKQNQNDILSNKLITEEEFADIYKKTDQSRFQVLDVRNLSEKKDGYLDGPNVVMIPLPELENKLIQDKSILSQNKDIYVFCKSGFRAVIAQSILAKFDITQTTCIGGMDKLKTLYLPIKYE